MIGLFMLILDLRNRLRFWMTLTVFNADSPMSMGVWLLTAFFLVSCLFVYCEVLAPARGQMRPACRRWIGLIGVVLALGVSVYTGVLLSASSIPLWRNLSLPLLFFLSAISTGFAGGAALGMLSLRGPKHEAMREPLRYLKGSYRLLLPLYLLFALLFLFSSIQVLATGWLNWTGWAGVIGIGILVPILLVMRKKPLETRQAWILFGCLLIGGFLLRTVLLY
jgi:formate-dependent nitrite reductase membrane component NrfD